MIHDERLKEYFEPYSAPEQIYRKYYEIQTDPETFAAQLQLLRKEIVEQGGHLEDYWLPDINLSQNSDVSRELRYPFHDDIVVAKHMRYHPLFTHYHDFYEMIYVFEGSCTNYVEGEILQMESGSVCIIPPHVSHSIGVFDDSIIANILIKKSAFDLTFSAFLSEDSALSSFFVKTMSEKTVYKYIHFPYGSKELNQIIEKLIIEELLKDKYSSPLKKVYLSEAFYRLLREQKNSVICSEYNEPYAKIMRDIRRYVVEHISEVSLKEMAAHFNYSVPYLSRLIRKATGHTFTDMLREIKIAKACELLERSDKKISIISDFLGYDAPVAFSRVFKKHMGMTPTEYRQNKAVPLQLMQN